MHTKISSVCDALNSLAEQCEQHAHNNNMFNQNLSQQKGWNHPAITPQYLVSIPQKLSEKIENANIEKLDGLDESAINSIPNNLGLLNSQQNLQQMFNGHGNQAIPPFLITLDWVQSVFDPIFSFENLENPKIPSKLRKTINSLNDKIENLDVESQELEKMISTIQEAHQNAESLPTDLAELNAARRAVEKAHTEIEEKSKEINTYSDEIEAAHNTAKNLLQESEKAYSITVTQGLAGAFQSRARMLSISMYAWVLGLLGALYYGVGIGGDRLRILSEVISKENQNIEIILIQLTMALLSLGAPIWFAWLSTKQISQNFRLAEDYNFKSSMAKAYEGYRREAARIDPVMEAKLLYSALNRLDEAPLRYVDHTYHASPWQELIASQEFRVALDNVPEFKSRFMDIITKQLPEKFKVELGKS